MMCLPPDTQEILWSNDSFMQLTGCAEDIFDNRIDDISPRFSDTLAARGVKASAPKRW